MDSINGYDRWGNHHVAPDGTVTPLDSLAHESLIATKLRLKLYEAIRDTEIMHGPIDSVITNAVILYYLRT